LRPARQAFGGIAWRGRTIQLGGTLQFLGDNYLSSAGRARVASRTIAGASVAVTPFGRDLTFTVEGKNLGDNRITDVGGYPLPGRSVFVACGFRATPATSQP
jgi:hypothetical protein